MQKNGSPIIENKSPSETVSSELILRGTIYGLLAAVRYTASNAFLRSSIDVDPTWVSRVKAIPKLVLFGPWLLLMRQRKRRDPPHQGR